MNAPKLKLIAMDFFERPIRLRLPFRFGNATLTEAPQVFVRARIKLGDGREGEGVSAEMLAPKWFDKSPELSNQWSSSPFCLALKLYALGCPRHIRILPGGSNTGDQNLSRSVFLELRARRAATEASPIPAARLSRRLAGKAE